MTFSLVKIRLGNYTIDMFAKTALLILAISIIAIPAQAHELGCSIANAKNPIELSNVLVRCYDLDPERENGCVAFHYVEMQKRHAGVCLDFAYLTARRLKTMSGVSQVQILTFAINRWEAHAITVFKWLDGYYYFSNRNIFGSYASIRDIMDANARWHLENERLGKYMVSDVTRNMCFPDLYQ